VLNWTEESKDTLPINAWHQLALYYVAHLELLKYYEAEGFVEGLVWLRSHGYKFTLQLDPRWIEKGGPDV
jgi:hypothetical protein